MRKMWELKQSAENTLALYIYGDVEGDSYDWWTGQAIESETSANHFRDELSERENVTQIDIYINSLGGSVLEGTAIYNQLRRHPAQKTVYVDGFACSVASVIAMAGDKVVMPKNTMMMIHNAWKVAAGNAADLRKSADDLDQINKGNRQAYLQKAGEKLTEEKLVEMMDTETWLTAQECIDLGLADELAEKDADMSNAAAVLQKANLNLEQHMNIRKSLAAQVKDLTEPTEQEPSAPPESPAQKYSFLKNIKKEHKNDKF